MYALLMSDGLLPRLRPLAFY